MRPGRRWYYPPTLFLLRIFVGMLIGTYPYMIPPYLTLFEAASPDSTLAFMLWGVGPILPIILGYNYYLHKIFSGTTNVREESYEDA